ncbi:hypothetical protein AX15_004148 [Amanita polypyramis BW_CC]|nr:hypothetical protein AX15_004148 [Amanita polypyramis BW_CC]
MNTHTAADAIRSTKRKLDQAFQSLDAAVGSTDSLDRPPPKRVHTSGSLYSTLAKYGINIKDTKSSQSPYRSDNLAKSAPNLSAILSRTASRAEKASPFRLGNLSTAAPSLPTAAEYRPSSISSFLSRLATYKLSTYASKPPVLDAVAAAKCGWINNGKDRLVCGLCKGSWVVTGREGMTREAANTLLEKQRAALVEAHKDGCAWKSRQCDDSIYRVPLQPPAVMLRELKRNAIVLDPLLEGIIIKHPLTGKQLQSLRTVTASLSHTVFESHDSDRDSASRPSSPVPIDSEPSDNATLASLFGWSLVPPTALEAPSRRTPLSRASSIRSSITPPRTPSISRTPRDPYPKLSVSTLSSISMLSFGKAKPLSCGSTVLFCPLCQRRIGLWAFTPRSSDNEGNTAAREGINETSPAGRNKAMPQRPLDLLKEHRSFCPYVVRSTVVPSLPLLPSSVAGTNQLGTNHHQRNTSSASQITVNGGSLEGWRAVLTTVVRYGMKQRVVGDVLSSKMFTQDFDNNYSMEVDAVKAMVTGVKRQGGRDLLKYVRSLLG